MASYRRKFLDSLVRGGEEERKSVHLTSALPIGCGEGDRRLQETLQLEIIAVLESLNRLRESPDYELCQISEKKPGVLDELAAERKKLLEKESGELRQQADKLAEEIKELGGEGASRIA